MSNFKNFPNITTSKILKFLKLFISKNNNFSEFYNLENYQNSINFQFYKFSYISGVQII